MAFTLPIGETGDSINRISLDGTTYDIRTRFNSLSGCWYAYIGLSGQDPVLKTKLVVGWELLAPYQATVGVPQGSLYVFDNDEGIGRPDRDDIEQDGRFELIYLTVGETLESFLESGYGAI